MERKNDISQFYEGLPPCQPTNTGNIDVFATEMTNGNLIPQYLSPSTELDMPVDAAATITKNKSIQFPTSERRDTRNFNGQIDTKITSLIYQLENEALVVIKNCKDECKTFSKSHDRLSAALLSPAKQAMNFQIKFLFGMCNWRRRRSIHASLLRKTLRQQQDNQILFNAIEEKSCTCTVRITDKW